MKMVKNYLKKEEVLSIVSVSPPHQNQFLCLAVLKGRLRVFYDFTGKLEELGPTSDLKVNDAEPRVVSLSYFSVSLSVSHVYFDLKYLVCVGAIYCGFS